MTYADELLLMSITQNQYEQLNEMGISLWQRRAYNNQADTEEALTPNYLEIKLNDLAKQQLFIDILLAIDLSIGEVNLQDDHLDLGLFNWYFSADQSQNEIQWHKQKLFTPSINTISQSSALKRQLWQILRKCNE